MTTSIKWAIGVIVVFVFLSLTILIQAEAAAYKNCTELRKNHPSADITRSHPLYQSKFDRDNDGIACEKKGASTTKSYASDNKNTGYRNCTELREDYPREDITRSHPLYQSKFDRDNDGIACERKEPKYKSNNDESEKYTPDRSRTYTSTPNRHSGNTRDECLYCDEVKKEDTEEKEDECIHCDKIQGEETAEYLETQALLQLIASLLDLIQELQESVTQ